LNDYIFLMFLDYF